MNITVENLQQNNSENSTSDKQKNFVKNPELFCEYEDKYLEMESTIFSETLDVDLLIDAEKRDLFDPFIKCYKRYKRAMGPIQPTKYEHNCMLNDIYEGYYLELFNLFNGAPFKRIYLGCKLMYDHWQNIITSKRIRDYVIPESTYDCPFKYLYESIDAVANSIDLYRDIEFNDVQSSVDEVVSSLYNIEETNASLPSIAEKLLELMDYH